MEKPIEFGNFTHDLRKEKKYSLKIAADKLGIDISLLSKIEHGEMQVQSHMLKTFAELFKIDYKEIQMKFLNKKLKTNLVKSLFF